MGAGWSLRGVLMAWPMILAWQSLSFARGHDGRQNVPALAADVTPPGPHFPYGAIAVGLDNLCGLGLPCGLIDGP